MKKKLLFLINPVSGSGNPIKTLNLIKEHVDKDIFSVEIEYTRFAGHGHEMALNAVKDNYDAVIVAGGDGSVNEIASALANTKVKLGIIPNGSGNGLARHLKIPVKQVDSIRKINEFKHICMDTFTVNQQFACNLAGIGFDANVAYKFDKAKKRGLFTYVSIILRSYFFYKPASYKILYDKSAYETKALLIAIANSNQFGNGAQIAPQANISDGYLDVCILDKVSLLKAPWLGLSMITGRTNKLKNIKYLKLKEFTIENNSLSHVHIDGDPVSSAKNLSVKINPLSLNVLI